MDSISDRIAWIIKESGLTKTAFGERLNISQQHISNLALGRKIPSDRTIADICREFGVSEVWLRTGQGEPKPEPDREEEIASWIGKVLSGDDEFKKDFVAVLARLDENAWAALAQFSQQLLEQRRRREEDTKKESEP